MRQHVHRKAIRPREDENLPDTVRGGFTQWPAKKPTMNKKEAI